MNYAYVLHHVSGHLHTPVRSASLEAPRDIQSFGAIVDFSDELYGPHVLRASLAGEEAADVPRIFSLWGVCAYGIAYAGQRRHMIGPVCFSEPVRLIHTLEEGQDGLPAEKPDPEWLRAVPVCAFRDFAADLLLLHNLTRDGSPQEPYVTMDSLIAENSVPHTEAKAANEKLTEMLFNDRENGFVHNPYNHEARERAAIQNGNVEELHRILEEDFTGRFGTLSKEPRRQEINLGIVTVTIATRAAIDGGLHPETAFYISDNAIQRMEAAADIPTIRHIYRSTEFKLAEIMKELHESRQGNPAGRENKHISHCKDYIFSHLHDKLTVGEIAHAIGLEKNYLSALFRRCEQMTLKAYIMNEKIKLAKNLLVYSSYSYSRIAAYLGFSSQSHLGSEFRKTTGMTLKEYRDAFAREDFVHDQMFRSES